MLNIFKELSGMGFSNLDNIDLFPAKKTVSETQQEEKTICLEDVLYDKTYVCPICNKEIKSKTIKSGKNRLLDIEIDLKQNFEVTNPTLYECVVCHSCGYAGLSKNFSSLSATQKKLIKEEVCSKYQPVAPNPLIDEKEAIIRHKLALISAMAKKAKNGEKAYICLKTAWLYRDLKDEANEIAFLKLALEGFENAYSSESFPIFELDEMAVAYIISNIYLRLKDYEKATKWVSFVVLDKNASSRLKTKAIDLKALIVEQKNKMK